MLAGLPTLAEWAHMHGTQPGQPVLLRADGWSVPEVNGFFASARMRNARAGTRRKYAFAVAVWLGFLDAVGRAWHDADEEDVAGFKFWRMTAEANVRRVAGGTVLDDLVAISAFYRWAGFRFGVSDPVGRRQVPGPGPGTVTESFEAGPHLVRSKDVKWLDPAGYARRVDVGLRGLDLRGREIDGWRGRNSQRDCAFVDGLYGIGLRLSEWASVLRLELPADDETRTYYTCRLAETCAKGGRGRRFWMPRSVLVDVLAYEEGERAAAVRRAQRACRYERLPGLLLVERRTRNRRLEMRDAGGRRMTASLDSLDPGARERLFRRTAVGLEPLAVWLNEDGLPRAAHGWQHTFGTGNERVARAGLTSFEANAHMMRHSFALRWYPVGRLLYERQVAHLNAEEVRDFRAQFGDTWYLVKTLLGRLHERGRTCFGEVSLADLDDYAAHVKATETSHGQREDRLSIVNRVWSYRDLLPEADRLPQTPPWRGERIQDILQQRRAIREENRTPRIHPETMSALLAWSLRFVETFAEDITAAFSEHLVLSERSGRSRGGRAIPPQRRPKGALTDDLRVLLSDYRERGRPLPGIRDNDGTLRVNLSHLGKVLDTARGALDNPSNRAVFAEMGLPVIEGTPLDAPVTGQLGGQPWHDGAIEYTEAGFLARHLSTACFIVISYLSGMRSGEALSLKRGCVERDHAHGLVLLRGRHWKGVRDAAGDKMPEGEIRADPWVVTEAVATAVAVLERLHTSTWLFPATLFTDGRDGATILRSRVGGSRSETRINHDIAEFLAWVETYCTEHGRSDRIPPDPVHPVIYSARLRRTLAWFIVRRPRGLVAAAIQYGHLRVQMTLGYAGNYASGFPDDLAFEDWLARLDTLADAHQRLREGEQVSGPAAETYRHRVQAATRFAGRVLRTKRHATTMLANPDLQIFPGKGMTCVLDPKRAACRLRSEEDSTRRTPDLDDCRPNCVNIARTDRDIEQVLVQIERLRPLVDDPLAPAFRHAPEQHELDRLERIATAHDRTGEPHDGH